MKKSCQRVKGFFDKLYELIPGTYFGITSISIICFSVFFSLVLYVIEDPSYSIFTHWISNLGIGPVFSQMIFNNGFLIVSSIMFLFLNSETRALKTTGTPKPFLILMTFFSLTLSLGLLMIGMWPMTLPKLHCVAAVFYFFSFYAISTIYSIVVLINKNIDNKRAIISIFTAVMHVIYYFMPMLFTLPSGVRFGLTITFLEWTTFCSQLCFIIHILYQSIKSRTDQKVSLRSIYEQFISIMNERYIQSKNARINNIR